MKTEELNLGDDHWLRWLFWKPDKVLNPQYADTPNEAKIGGIICHRKADGSICEGSIWFDCDIVRRFFAKHPRWTVNSWQPLDCSPSFLCHCGDHGFIRNGKWVRA